MLKRSGDTGSLIKSGLVQRNLQEHSHIEQDVLNFEQHHMQSGVRHSLQDFKHCSHPGLHKNKTLTTVIATSSTSHETELKG